MDKLIAAAFVLVIGAVIWALGPPSEQTTPDKQIASEQVAKTVEFPSTRTPDESVTPNRRIARFRIGKDGKPEGGTLPESVKAQAVPLGRAGKTAPENCDVARPPAQPDTPHPDYDEDPKDRIPKNEVLNPWPVVTEGEFAVKNWVDPDKNKPEYFETKLDEDIYPPFEKSSFKDSVQKFFGGLPEDGQMPETVYIADVLPPPLVAQLKLPAETKLTMLGAHYTNDVRSYRNAMAIPKERTTVFGISYVTPDGQYTRKYIQLRGPKKE